jgi:hypothetical protein
MSFEYWEFRDGDWRGKGEGCEQLQSLKALLKRCTLKEAESQHHEKILHKDAALCVSSVNGIVNQNIQIADDRFEERSIRHGKQRVKVVCKNI